MFDTLTDRLTGVFKRLSGKGRITEADVDDALREVRRALLEADVNLQVVRGLQTRIRERAIGVGVIASVAPAHQVVKIVQEELTAILGHERRALATRDRPGPAPILLV
ncbi:MAG: signal recognition particle receptor subunit alpha, partial [Chloroflexi bacterium]|nr:signal recognition particle receptor subunit alpha [Chloroflexota bacterium]